MVAMVTSLTGRSGTVEQPGKKGFTVYVPSDSITSVNMVGRRMNSAICNRGDHVSGVR